MYSTKIFEQYPDIIYNSLNHIYLDDKAYEINKNKNKDLLEPLKEVFKNWYKTKFSEFSEIINENELSKFIELPLQKYYDEAYQKEISKIPDFEFQSSFHKSAHRERIKELLEPQKEELHKYFNAVIKNYTEHKKALGTNFVLEFLTKEFLKAISKKSEEKINFAKKIIKKDLDIEVQNTAKEIYDNLTKGVNIDFIPKCEDDDEEENEK